jgi:very-short-patch-repair endonuclease
LIADFYHHPQRLVIEIDGEIHNKKEVRKNDKVREELLEEKGYTIIRFKNEEVFANIDLVLQKIKEKIKKLKTSPPLFQRRGSGEE